MFRALIKSVLVTLLIFTGLVSSSYADFYVIPVVQKTKNLITVGKTKANYKNLQSALDSITDASPLNTYLISVGAGEYNVTTPIQMKSYVNIVGSGRATTILQGNINSSTIEDAAIILGANNATLTHLSVINRGGTYDYAIAIYNNGVSPYLYNLTVIAEGGTNCIGIFNTNASPTIANISAMATNCLANIAIRSDGSSSPSITNIIASASGGTSNIAISSHDTTDTTVSNSTLSATYALSNTIAVRSTIEGSTNLTAKCYLCIDEHATALDEDCN